MPKPAIGRNSLISSHLKNILGSVNDETAGWLVYIAGLNVDNLFIYLSDQTISTVDECNAHFKAQYDNGNPYEFVIVCEPTETDISDLLTEDNFIKVEGGGVIRAVNEYKQDAPSTIKYTVKVGN
jgi:6-phosphofructokinase